jgi:hypothetical protein
MTLVLPDLPVLHMEADLSLPQLLGLPEIQKNQLA